MKAELELVYNQWREAMISANLPAWEASMALYRRMETRNRIVSEKQPWPEAMFDSPVQPPPLNNLINLGILTRRDTASSIYFGKADFEVSDPAQIKDVLLVLLYLKEEGRWKFDRTRIVRIGSNTDVLHKIRLQDFSFLEGEEFQPLDSIPPIQPAVPAPQLMAEVWVTSLGYEAEIWVNGFLTGKIANTRGGRELVMGGVKLGQNQIVIRTRKTQVKDVPSSFEIALYAAPALGQPAKRVFHYGPAIEVEPEIRAGFTGN